MKERDQGQESDLQTRFHANLDQLRDEIKYRETVERELEQTKEEVEKLTTRFNTLGKKLSEATDDKHRVEISLEDMRHNLIEAQEERSVLGENLSEAQNQIEELMQLNTTGGSGQGGSTASSGGKSAAEKVKEQGDLVRQLKADKASKEVDGKFEC